MDLDQCPSSFKIRLTIAKDECPSVHKALSHIRDPKHRAHRLRELAAKGLLLETCSFASVVQTVPGTTVPTPAPGQTDTSPVGGITVGDSLQWDAEATLK